MKPQGKYKIETNKKENTIHQKSCNAVKAALRGKCIAVEPYIKKKEISHNSVP